MNKIFIILPLIILISGCTKTTIIKEDQAIQLCIDLCKQELEKGTDLNNGPCLSNDYIDDWVCDVAHNPRQDIDNSANNQCSDFRDGKASHFVEVDINCNLIKSY